MMKLFDKPEPDVEIAAAKVRQTKLGYQLRAAVNKRVATLDEHLARLATAHADQLDHDARCRGLKGGDVKNLGIYRRCLQHYVAVTGAPFRG